MNISSAINLMGASIPQLFPSALFFLLKQNGEIVDISDRNAPFHSVLATRLSEEKFIQSVFEISDADLLAATVKASRPYQIRKSINYRLVFWDDLETDLPVAGLRLLRIDNEFMLGIFNIVDLLPNVQHFGMGAFFLLDKDENFRAYNSGLLSEKRDQSGSSLIGLPFGNFFEPSIREMEEAAFALSGYDAAATEKIFATQTDFIKINGYTNMIGSSAAPSVVTFPLGVHEADNFIWIIKGRVDYGEAPQLLFGRLNTSAINIGSGCIQVGASSSGFMIKRNGMKIRWQKEFQNAANDMFDYKWVKNGNTHEFFSDGKSVLRVAGDFPTKLLAEAFQIMIRPHSRVEIETCDIRIKETKTGKVGEFGVVREKDYPFRTFQIARFVNPILSTRFLEYEGWVLNDASHFVKKADDYKSKYAREAKSRRELAAIVDRLTGSDVDVMVGNTPEIRKIMKQSSGIANSAIPVLITGETGTGKEMLARYIHKSGIRHNKPFVKVDCSAIPLSLIESVLFGHEKGAFTGALERRIGLFEAADHGILFLDEIGNIPLHIQSKLLGVIQDKAITRIGGTNPVKLDIMIISATKDDVLELIRKKEFREDLYYRLNGITMEIPPLRERKDDIAELCNAFISTEPPEKRPVITPEALRKMHEHDWPGNIRELNNVIQRAMLFCADNKIKQEHIVLDEKIRRSNGRETNWEKVRAFTRSDWVSIMEKTGGNITHAASAAGVTRKAVYDNLRKHSISAKLYRSNP